tara:strand:+ start:340 stop:897 length:558 start_codon:yes stop_codon:yes gene_type:complete
MCSPEAYFAAAVGNMFLARSQMKSEVAFAEAARQEEREQIKDESIQLALETVEKQNILAQQFQEDLAANRAILAAAGIDEQSYSYQALLADNKIKQKTDLRNINLEYLSGQRDLSYAKSDSQRRLQATKIGARNRFYGSVLDSAVTAGEAAKGILGPTKKSSGIKPFKGPNYAKYSESDKRLLGD